MSLAKYSNNAQSTLAGAISDSQTTIVLASGGGAEFPTLVAGQQFTSTLTDAATGLLREIVVVTARTGDTLTVLRGQEDTTPLAWQANDLFAQLNTAGQMAALVQNVQAQAQSYNYADDVGSANAYQVVLDPSVNDFVVGMPIRALIQHSNTGASTLDYGAGLRTIVRRNGSALIGNELVAGQIATFIDDGTNVQVMEPAPATAAALAAGTDTQSFVTPAQFSGGQVPLGAMLPYSGGSGSVGANYLLPFGQAVSRATYSDLFTLYNLQGLPYGVGNGTTTFNLPDARGRSIFGLDNMGGSAAGRLTGTTMTPNGTTLGAVGGAQTETAAVSVTGNVVVSGVTAGSLGVSSSGVTDNENNDAEVATGSGTFVASGTTGGHHGHAVAINGTTSGTLLVSANGANTLTGSTASVTNIPPAIAMNIIIRVL